jgi:hypothetical protein
MDPNRNVGLTHSPEWCGDPRCHRLTEDERPRDNAADVIAHLTGYVRCLQAILLDVRDMRRNDPDCPLVVGPPGRPSVDLYLEARDRVDDALGSVSLPRRCECPRTSIGSGGVS